MKWYNTHMTGEYNELQPMQGNVWGVKNNNTDSENKPRSKENRETHKENRMRVVILAV